ncbi:hypothetical protein GCM10009789_37940 [Kribbella sancticallisti]|uniref:Phosphotyrosine protein phosphatase I domain-containing protein n=1 Tax=Kribbella sancticallisti TaxID=460087 RepID=A0ABN2DMC6_9ACTN
MPRNLEDFELLNTSSQLRRAAQHVFEFYDGAIPLDECELVTIESYDLLARTAHIRHHLVPLAERWSIDRLRRLGKLSRRLTHSTLEVLFVDADDTIAAPIAAALLTSYARGRLNVGSAAISPGTAVGQGVVQAMADTAIDISEAFPKPLTADAVQAADVVVQIGALPALAGLTGAPGDTGWAGALQVAEDDLPVERRRLLRWDRPNPADGTAEAIAAARDELDRRVLLLLADLMVTPRR